MIILTLISALLLQPTIDPIDDLAEQLVARLVATPAANIVRLTADDDVRVFVSSRSEPPSTRVTVYSRDATSADLGYRRVDEVRLRDLPSLIENANSRTDVYISLTPRPPRFALALGGGGQFAAEAQRLLASALVARVAGEAPLVLDDGFPVFGAAFPLIGDELDVVRSRLRNAGLHGLVHTALYRDAISMRLACQIVSVDPGDDDLFSIKVTLTPELSALLQATPSAGNGSQVVVARLPLMDNALAVCALDADGDEDTDIAVLTPGEVLFFHHDEAGLQPFRAISLGNLAPAAYATRVPVGSITPADIDGDGRDDLLVSSNAFTLGAVVYPAQDFRVEQLSGAPVASTQRGSNSLVVTSEYVIGEDVFGGSAFVGDGQGQNSAFQPSLPPMIRRLVAVPAQGSTFMTITRDWRLLLLRSGADAQVIDTGEAEIRGISAGIGRIILAFSLTGGESVIQVGLPDNGRFSTGASTTTALDIRDLAIYNSAIHSATYIAILGHEDGVGMVLEVRRLPTSVGV